MLMKDMITSSLILAIILTTLSPAVVPVKAQLTLPVPRDQTVITEIMSSPYFTVFDKANPYIPQGTQWGSGWHQLVQEYDWYINYATGEIIYWRVTGWEYSSDYKVFTMHVRRGVTWNDGYPYTAKDIAFTINMVKAHPTFGGSSYLNEWVDSVETPDDYTIIIHLKKPNPRFHHTFRMWSYLPYIVPEHIWKDVDPETFSNWPPVDTGPYKLYGVYPEIPMFIWERRDDYWGKALGVFPAPKYVVWRGIPSADVDLEDFVRGDVDVVLPHIFTWEMIKTAMRRTPNVTLAPYTDPCPYGINSFNVAKYPFNITEFRWAIAYLVNRPALAKMYALSNGTPTTDWLLPMPYSWAIFDKYKPMAKRALDRIEKDLGFKLEYNPDKSKEILDSLGFKDVDGDGFRELPNGTRFTVELLLGEDAAHYIGYDLLDELKAVGIDATTKIGGALTGDLSARGLYDIRICTLCTPGWIMGDPVPTIDVFHSKWYVPIGNASTTPGIQGANPRYRNPDLDAIIDELWTIPLDDPRTPSLLEEAFYIIQRDCITVPAVEKTFVQTFSTKYWTGWPSQDNMYIVPYNWWPTFFFVLSNIKSTRAAPPVTTVTTTVTAATTETITVPTFDVASAGGVGIVALIVGVAVGWLVASRKK
jgi:peptide/nickel transport system substrate-binding protein